MTDRVKNIDRGVKTESIEESSETLFLSKQQITHEHQFSKALLEKSLDGLVTLLSQTQSSCIAENLTPSQLRADDSPKLTSTLAICVYEQPGNKRKAKAREILEWELAYASARQRLTAHVRALLNLCVLSRMENIEFDKDLAFQTIQEKLELLKARLQSAGVGVEKKRVLLAQNLLEAEYLIEKGLFFNSRNKQEEALACFKQALQPAFVGAEMGFRKWLLASLKWTAVGEMKAKHWLQGAVYFTDYCGRCLFHIREVVLQQSTPAVYSDSKNHVEKSNVEPRSQLKYFIPGNFVESFLNLCDCLFHLRLYEAASICLNYISSVVLSVDDEEITGRHFELKMNVNDSINREKRKALVSEDEDWDSEFGSLDAEELHPRFSNLFGDKFTQLNSEKDHRLTLLKEQMEVRSSFLKNSAFIKYPKPTVLYSLRLADGRMQLHEKEYESWLLHYSFVDDSKYKEGQQNLEVWSDSNKSIPTSNVILDRLKRLDQVTLEWAEMYFLLIWDTFREKKFSLMFKYADNYFSALHGANSVLSIDERKDDKKYEKLFQMSMEIEKIVRTSIKYSSTNTSMTTMKKNLHIIECTFPEMILRIKLYKVQCRGHNCLENENSTDFLEVTKNLLEIQRACCNIDNESWLSFETWDSINFDSVAFSTKDLDVQVDAIASLYFFLCERSPLTGKPLIHAGRNEGAIIPRRKDFQGLMKKLKLQYESIPSASHIKAKTAFVLAHYGFHSTGDKATAERQLFEALVIWKQYSNDHLTYPVPLLTGEFVQEVLNFLANILLQNGKAIYSLAASTAEHVVDFFMSKSQSIPVLLRCVRISKTAGLYPIAIGYLLQILETYLVPRAKLEFISYLLQTIDLAVEFGYFSCALELVECGVNYIQESINTSEQNAIRMNESKAKNLEKRLSSCSSNWRTRSFEELRIRSGILLTATGHFEAAQKSFRSLSLQSRDNRITLLCRLYLTEIDGMLNRHTECLSFCEQFERMTSLTVGQLFENVRLSFHLSLWDLDLTISEVAVFIKIRCLLRKQQFIEALRNTDFAFIKFHRGQLRHLGRLYYLRGKILTQMMIHLKDNVVCQSSNCFTTCFITKTERLVGPRTIQISSQGAQSMERRLEWRFSIQSKEDLVSQAVDSLFRSIGYFKKTGQDFLVAKAQLYIGKLINAYLSTQLRVEGTFKWSFLKENVRNYFKYFSKIENLEDIQADRLLISACKIWKHIYSLNELLNGYITLIEYYCLTGYDSGASYLFSECWLLLSDLFLTDLNIQSCIQLETSRSIEFVIKKLSKMAWILVTFFSEEEIQHYLLVFDALNNLKSRCYQMDSPSLNCPKDDSDVVQSCNNGHSALTTSDKNSEDHSKKETIEQHSVVGNKSSGITSNIHGCYPFYKNIDKRLNNIWSFAASGNEQVQFTFLEGSKGRHSIFQEGSRTIYELGEGTKKLFLNPQGQIQRIRHRVQQLYPIDISNFIEEIFSLNSKYSTYPIMELKQLYDTSWSIFYHLKMLKYQHLRGKLKNMEDWSRLNWRGWMEWLSISRGIRQESHCVNNIPKELAFKSLFIDYFDQCLLIYAPFRQIQYSIPLYRRFKGGETDSSIQQEGTLPLPFEVEKLLKELMLNEDNYVLRDVLPFQISMCFGRRKQSKSSQVTSKHIISSSALHSLLHNDSKLFRDTQFTLFVDPDIAFIPWEFILDIDAIRSESLSRLSYFWYRGQNNSTPCSISKVFWFDEKDGGSKNDFFITKKGSSQRGKERLETIVDFYWKRLIMDHATREEWRPWQGPIPMSYERSSSWLERWKDGRVETPHLLEANAIDLLRCFQLKNDAVHIPCFIFTFMDGLPRPWTTLGTFLECLPQAVSLFVPTKYMETFLQEHFPSIEHANKPLSMWIKQLQQETAQHCIPIFIYVKTDTAIKYMR